MRKFFISTIFKISNIFVLFILLCSIQTTKAQLKVISNGNVGLKLQPGMYNQYPERQVHMRGLLLIDSVKVSGGSGQEIGILFRKYNASTNPYCDWGIDLDGGGFEIFRGWPNSNWGNFKFFIKESNSYVGINTGSPSYRLDVNGNLRCYGFLNSSDERLKSNVVDIKNSLDVILQLKPKIYDLEIPINDQSASTKILPEGAKYVMPEPEILKNQAGFLAQEIEKVFPHLVSKDEQGYLSMNYIGLIPYLVDAIKEQNKQIEQLQEAITECCNLSYENTKKAIKEDIINSENHASLEQNNPNPFNQKTIIGYTIPKNCLNSSIHIYNMNGIEIKNYKITQQGKGSITVEASSLSVGMYLYTLICDGKEIATKKMILTN